MSKFQETEFWFSHDYYATKEEKETIVDPNKLFAVDKIIDIENKQEEEEQLKKRILAIERENDDMFSAHKLYVFLKNFPRENGLELLDKLSFHDLLSFLSIE